MQAVPDANVIASTASIVATMKATLKAASFRKDGRTWRRAGDEVMAVLNLQGSQWSRRFYVNLGIYVYGVDDHDKPSPADVHCHLGTRLCELVANRIEFEEAFDAESALDESIRDSRVRAALTTVALPFFEALSTKTAIKAALERPENLGLRNSSRATLKKYLGLATSL